MIINAPCILAVLFSFLEAVAGIVLLGASLRGLRATGGGAAADFAWEPLRHLLLLLVLLLAVLGAISLFVWALLLQSYVSQFTGLRCIVGVLYLGTGREGAAGWLPAMAAVTTWLRLGLLFAVGTGVVLHLASRDEPAGPLSRRHLAAIAAIGVLALLGAVVETSWIAVPKKDQSLVAGCCTGLSAATGAAPVAPLGHGTARALFAGFLASGLALATILMLRPGRRPVLGRILRIIFSTAFLVLGSRFATAAVAPALMGLPLHRCACCLGGEAPESLLGFALLAVPAFACGWRAAAGWLGTRAGPGVARLSERLDRAALFGVLGALLLFGGEWFLS